MSNSRDPRRLAAPFGALLLLLVLATTTVAADLQKVEVVSDDSGHRLQVDGEDLMVFGMNWGYMPIGQNYNYDFFGHSDEMIKAALDKEMSLLQGMGVNVIRHYVGIPPRWVEYIYDNYGIWTVVNHTLGRYGLTIDGVWVPATDYSDPKVIAMIRAEMAALVEEFKDTRGMLMWLLGNENNYGLHWSSFEIEALPEDERWAYKARYMYKMFGMIIDDLHELDPQGRPVAMANGDLGYIDIIAEECKGLDILGTNVYRGISARDLYEEVDLKLDVPVMYTEFGCDAFNAITMQEDQLTQARFLLGQWQEIYEMSAGKGRVGNCIGGMTFQWSDGWWKYQQTSNLDVHDTNASWPNGGYPVDYLEGQNNMNEEWWGICAKGFPGVDGIYDVYPRAAYYALRDAYKLDPYAQDTDLEAIRQHFACIIPMACATEARGDAAALVTDTLSKVRISGMRMEFETYSTGGKNVTTPPNTEPLDGVYPAYRGFDQGQSFYVDIEAKPNEGVIGNLSINVLGQVPENPIDEIFYENHGRPVAVEDIHGERADLWSHERVKVYQGSLSWDDRWFNLNAFYRTGHLHWQYEGDFFCLYRDAYYGDNVDMYNGMAPIGFELAGKKLFNGAKLAFGPQLWWGANPAIFLKYQRSFLGTDWTGVVQEDFTQQTDLTSSMAIPVRKTRKASLQMKRRLGPFAFEGGVLWSGQPRVGESFQLVSDEVLDAGGPVAAEDVKTDTIKDEDTLGFKAKLMWEKGRWHWYGQGAYMGLVAEAGPSYTHTFTGWTLKDSGQGNQMNALTGLAVNMGNWQFGPNFLWQKPVVGPMPHSSDLAGTPGRPRNWMSDPFAVIWNRETSAAELMITYDSQPATWMWEWDNDVQEGAAFAGSLGLVFKRHHTTADSRLFFSETGDIYAFPGSTPARDLWEVHARVVSNFGTARMIGHAWFGPAEPNGDNTRLTRRFGADARIAWPSVAVFGALKFDDFGPYDYHRDHNLTYPLQAVADLSYTLGKPKWFGYPQTMIGVRATYRTLDRYSPRYMPEGAAEPGYQELYPEGLDSGREWEIRTYLHLAI